MQGLSYDQKYILSVAYVNTESLTGGQKINILEKDLTETDTEMTGEEKADNLTELEGKISKLAEKYEVGK